MIAITKRNGPATTVERATHVPWENLSLEHTQHQLMPTIIGTDASRPPGIPDIMASSSVVSSQTLHFLSLQGSRQAAPSQASPAILLCKGMEQRCAGVSGNYRAQKKEFDVTKERWASPVPCCILHTFSMWGRPRWHHLEGTVGTA